MEQKLSLQQKLLQKLSPQQIQVIKLLELPALQLEQRIKKELEDNPVLEYEQERESSEETEDAPDLKSEKDNDDEEFSVEDYLPDDDDTPSYRLSVNNFSRDDKQAEIPFSAGVSFQEFLLEQLGLTGLTEHQQKIAEYIIGNFDEDGYLRRDLGAISDDLAFTLNIEISEEELEILLKAIQEFDPPGVGARDLQECLLIQLKRKEGPGHQLARSIIKDYFPEFARKHYDKIQKRLDLDEEQLKPAIDEILKLNPRPGSSFSNPLIKSDQHVIPDFLLDNQDGELHLTMNQQNVPELRINDSYLEMFKSLARKKSRTVVQQKEALTFVKQKLESAKWFIDAVQQRHHTLMVTMSEIINFQKKYFLEGDETKLRPMILKDIAERTGLDISTISRVSNSKYIQTHFGTFPLKYFFSEAMHKDDGQEVSTREIKKILQDCIDNEDKRKPMTDDKLAKILKKKSYNIARRTVAKYREQLGIQVARLRKEL